MRFLTRFLQIQGKTQETLLTFTINMKGFKQQQIHKTINFILILY